MLGAILKRLGSVDSVNLFAAGVGEYGTRRVAVTADGRVTSRRNEYHWNILVLINYCAIDCGSYAVICGTVAFISRCSSGAKASSCR